MLSLRGRLSGRATSGYLYAVAMLVVLVTQSLLNAYSSQMMYILGMNVKTAVTAAVYRNG